ncbi:hypothetical protein DM02DRAFT_167280 [Periconia macrospinosa]|uniref:Uncharacterized protein n=1 Tax=Periconia macrospinosa TaxID=97972 RepID=A0A2V1E5D4_9PLEO|nr:hypothetical protein DM02DRAFT_167280 [Periconia macrospinosa]
MERSSYYELIRDGGRPVCSIDELSDILAAPKDRYRAVRPWLCDDRMDPETGIGGLHTIFSRQFEQWWEFRKSQWDGRGLDNTGAGLTAFIESCRRQHEGAGSKRWVVSPEFEQMMRTDWEEMPPQLPVEEQTFTAYSKAVNRRLAPHHFTIRLSKDPQKQSVWATWLEYLSFKIRVLETLTDRVGSQEPRYHACRKKLLDEREPKHPLRETHIDTAAELAALSAELCVCYKSIDDIIQGTDRYVMNPPPSITLPLFHSN